MQKYLLPEMKVQDGHEGAHAIKPSFIEASPISFILDCTYIFLLFFIFFKKHLASFKEIILLIESPIKICFTKLISKSIIYSKLL